MTQTCISRIASKKTIKNLLIKIFAVILFITIVKLSHAQSETKKIQLLGMNDGTAITLRWKTADANSFARAKTAGFIVEQKVVDKGISFSNKNFITSTTIFPFDKEKFQQAIRQEKNNRNLIACAAIMYPDFKSEVHEQDFSGHLNMVKKIRQQHSVLMSQADLSPHAAEALGLRHVIKRIDPTKDYYFRVRSTDKTGTTAYSNIIKISGSDKTRIPSPQIFDAVENDSLITLRWEKELHESFFIAYVIERAGSSGEFAKLVSLPYFYHEDPAILEDLEYITFNDKVANNIAYRYRIKGITPFGERTGYSNTINASAKDLTPPNLPDSLSIKYSTDGEIIMNWEYIYSNKSPDLASINVLRSQFIDKDFEQVGMASLSENSFADDIDITQPYYFYRLELIDKSGNHAYTNPSSVAIPDETPPDPPVLISATIDTAGKVTITWEENKEHDILGYQVFFSNNEFGGYSNLINKPYKGTEWTYQLELNALNEDIYFKLQALDNFYNHSKFSEAIKLKRPDIVPPLPAYFKDYLVSINKIFLEWQVSQSTDLTTQILRRKNVKTGVWKELMIFDNTQSSYTDLTAQGEVLYDYDLISIDDNGNETAASKTLRLKAMGKLKLDAIKNFSLQFDDQKKTLDLTWEKSMEDIRTYIIYRSVNDGPFKSLRTIKPNITETKDYKIKSDRSYSYYIIAIGKNGKKSKKSKIINHTS